MKNKLIAVIINACVWFCAFQYFTVFAPALYEHGSSAAFDAMIFMSIVTAVAIFFGLVIGLNYWEDSK